MPAIEFLKLSVLSGFGMTGMTVGVQKVAGVAAQYGDCLLHSPMQLSGEGAGVAAPAFFHFVPPSPLPVLSLVGTFHF